jgi:hypothetical protein
MPGSASDDAKRDSPFLTDDDIKPAILYAAKRDMQRKASLLRLRR